MTPDTGVISQQQTPLYVDLDGSLTYADLLFESTLVLIKRNPLYVFMCFVWLLRGIAHAKAEIAKRADLDASLLPYNEAFLSFLQQQRATGRRLVLASASNGKLVQRVADHLGVFDAWIASDESINLKSHNKLKAIEKDAAGRGFAYAANGAVDLPIWSKADEVIVVNAPAALVAKAAQIRPPSLVIPPRRVSLVIIAKALRLHQWAKNALLFVPLLAAHSADPAQWRDVLLGFIAFGMCASATYIINDLLDLSSDRQHPRKRRRPFAAALLSIPFGAALVASLLPLSLWLAFLLSPRFLSVLVLYIVVTLAYSLRLKQVTFVDVLVLASLYTYRVLAGGIAGNVLVSNWLLAISLFMFLSLALVKRCAELESIGDAGRESLVGRGYRSSDLPYLISMGISSGFVAMMVLALYIDSQSDGVMYPHYELLWLTLPVMLYWIMRLWLKTSRMEIHDDPLQFAITDPASWLVAAIVGCIALAASFRMVL